MSNPISSERVGNSGITWRKLRLPALLVVLLGLSLLAWRSWSWNHATNTARVLLRDEENRQAIQTLDAMKNRFGDAAQVRLMLAQAHRQLGNKDAFERQLDLGRSLGLSAETVQGEKLLMDAQLGILRGSESQIANYLEMHPENFDDAARSLVFGLLRNQDFDAASRFLELWQSQSPEAPWIPTFRSMMHLARRDWKMALTEIEPALTKHSSFVPLYLQAGIAYQGDQQLEVAESMLDRYLRSQPDNAEALLRYSEVLRKLGKTSEALQRLENSLELLSDPTTQIQPSLRLQMAKLYLDADENQKAIDTLEPLSEKWPEDVEVASTLSQAFQRLGDETRAEAYAAIADAGQQETVLADRMLFELLSNPNRTASQCYELGHLLLHKQSRENGIYWLEAALKLDENFAPAHRDLALYYDRTDQPHLSAVHKRYLALPAEQ